MLLAGLRRGLGSSWISLISSPAVISYPHSFCKSSNAIFCPHDNTRSEKFPFRPGFLYPPVARVLFGPAQLFSPEDLSSLLCGFLLLVPCSHFTHSALCHMPCVIFRVYVSSFKEPVDISLTLDEQRVKIHFLFQEEAVNHNLS